MLTSKNWNQYALVPAKKNGCDSMAKVWPMVWMKPRGLELPISLGGVAKTTVTESKRDVSSRPEKRILERGKPGRREGGLQEPNPSRYIPFAQISP